jgi:hypothetical protein
MGIWVVLTIVAVAAVSLGLWAFRRSPTPKAKTKAKTKVVKKTEYWGVELSAPAPDRACARAQVYLGKAFPIAERPSLPLPDCSFPQQCQCHFIKLIERRKGQRRSGENRRAAGMRFEKDKTPRRSGNDRRKKTIDWF